MLVSARRHAEAAKRFFRRALSTPKVKPSEVVTDAVLPPGISTPDAVAFQSAVIADAARPKRLPIVRCAGW